jgi:broad specificity phosphatase PhoE
MTPLGAQPNRAAVSGGSASWEEDGAVGRRGKNYPPELRERQMAGGTLAGAGESGGRTLVYLARHGQTPLNESDVLRGLADPPLNETGRDQAQRLGAALGPLGLRAVISSPLLRARQTAQPVAECSGLEVATDQCLVDRDYGQWTGISRDAVVAQWGSVDRAPGVEPRSAVADRAVKGLSDIARRCLGGIVTVVSHDAVNRQVLVAFDAGLGDPDTIPQDNGCFNTLLWKDDRWAVLSVNELPGGP